MSIKKASVNIAGAYGVRMLAGLLVSKLIAIYTGPNGVAILGQFQNFINLLKPLSTLGTGNGVVRLLSEKKEDEEYAGRIKNSTITLGIIISISISLLILIFAKYLNQYLFDTRDYVWLLRLTSLSVIFFSLNEYFYAFFNGYADIKSYTKVNMLQSIDVLVLSVIFMYFFKLDGALLVVVAGQVIQLAVNYFVISKKKIFNFKDFKLILDKKITKVLFSFFFITLANAISVAVTMIFIRSYLIKQVGEEYTGYWQAVWRISEVYLGFITMFLKVYLFPRLSSNLKNKDAYNKELLSVLKAVIPVSLVAISSTYFLKDYIIQILFSKEFLPAANFFTYQLLGDFFQITSWVFGYHMLARTMTKLVVISAVVSNAIFAILSYYLISIFSVEGVTIAYAINCFIYLLFVITVYINTKDDE